MEIKIIQHIMPWDIDYSLLSFSQFKKSKYYLVDDKVNITIETCLNLSSHIFDWEKSKIPKEFFIEKYKQISQLLVDYNHIQHIYEGDQLYGHLDFQRECIEQKTEYYICTCPDMYFSEYLLTYLIEGIKEIKNKYFVLTPQISKMWDSSWDEITNNNFKNIPHKEWDTVDIFDVINKNNYPEEDTSIMEIQNNKWAGWFDVYNKAFYEELCPFNSEWKGYGGYDYYSMLVSEYAKKHLKYDFKQYVINGQTIFEYGVGPLKDGGFYQYYKNMLVLNKIPNQRKEWDESLLYYVEKQIKNLTK